MSELLGPIAVKELILRVHLREARYELTRVDRNARRMRIYGVSGIERDPHDPNLTARILLASGKELSFRFRA